MDLFLEFHSHKPDVGRLNYGDISLIPKLKEANKYNNIGRFVY